MDVAFWILIILNSLLAVVFVGSGVLKLVRPREALPAVGMHWTADATNTQVKLVGIVDAVGGLGLLLPVLTNIAPILTPIASIGLVVLMAFAIALHVRRKESAVRSIVLLVLCIVSAVLGFFVVLG